MAEGYFELRPVGPYSFGVSVRYEGRRSGRLRSRCSSVCRRTRTIRQELAAAQDVGEPAPAGDARG